MQVHIYTHVDAHLPYKENTLMYACMHGASTPKKVKEEIIPTLSLDVSIASRYVIHWGKIVEAINQNSRAAARGLLILNT